MSEQVARELNIGRKCTDWMILTANGNWSELTKVAESVPINVDSIVIPVPIFSATSASHHTSCEITTSPVDGLEKVTFVATFQGDKRDRFASSLGNLYA